MNDQEKIEFGAWVRSERLKKGLTQTELAETIGVSSGSISGIETGTARSIGRKMKNKLKSFFAGENITVLSHNSHSHITLGDRVQSNTHAHTIRCTDKVLEMVSSIAIQKDFLTRVNKISEALNCTRDYAAYTIFLAECNKESSLEKN